MMRGHIWGHPINPARRNHCSTRGLPFNGIPLGSTTIQCGIALRRPELLKQQGFRPFSLRGAGRSNAFAGWPHGRMPVDRMTRRWAYPIPPSLQVRVIRRVVQLLAGTLNEARLRTSGALPSAWINGSACYALPQSLPSAKAIEWHLYSGLRYGFNSDSQASASCPYSCSQFSARSSGRVPSFTR